MKTPIYTGLFQSDLDASGYKLIGLPTPTVGSDAATKAYVDAHAGGGGGTGASFVTNVKDYGALGNGVTNDTAAIQSAINAVHAAGGGVVFFPNGVYIIGGALQTAVSSSNPNSQLYVPLTTDVSTAQVIKLLGETPPSMLGTALISWPKPLTGVVLKSTIAGSGTTPAIIGSTYVASGWGNFNNVQLALENLTFMVETFTGTTHTAPSMSGINAGNLQLFSARNVRVTTESPNYDSADPASANVAGIITPAVNNDGWTYLEGILVEAFTNGIVVNEHTQGEQINIFACTNGLNFLGGNHSSNFDQLLIHWCKHNVTISGSHYFTIYNTAIEDIPSSVATKWYNNVTDLNDVGNNGHGNYWFTRVISSFGVDNAGFVKTGGNGVLCNAIGDTTVYIGTDARFTPITGGVKLEVRNASTGVWVEATRYTNP